MGNCHSHINFNPYIVHHTPFRQLNASVKHFIVSFLLKIQTFFSNLRKGREERERGEGGRRGLMEEGRKNFKGNLLPAWEDIQCKKARKICLGAQQRKSMSGSAFLSSFMCMKA